MNTQQPFWSLSVEETEKKLETSRSGLSPENVQKRQAEFGRNEVEYRRPLGALLIFFNQFRSPLILILVFAGILTVVLGEWVEAIVIFAAILLNTLLGFWQENKAENTLALLNSYIRTRSRVIRGGKEIEIDAVELVPGDVIRLHQGDRVPADARLIYVSNFEVDEAILTGESMPVSKQISPVATATGIGEQSSMVFSGTLVSEGLADAFVTSIGSHTEFGKIAALVATGKQEMTPLQRAVKKFSVTFGAIIAVSVALLFGLGLAFHYDIVEMFLLSIAVAVAAVPEGLPITLTVILAMGVQRLAAKKGVVRKMVAAETMGSVSLILTDKTGTLTQALMQLTDVVPADPAGQTSLDGLLRLALYNNNVIIANPADDYHAWELAGRPIEVALVKAAAGRNILLSDVLQQAQIIDRVPFDSLHKFSATLVRQEGLRVVLLGAPDILVKKCDLSDEKQREILTQIEERAYRGERVLGLAIKELSEHARYNLQDRVFEKLTFMGLFTFRDPLRPNVRDAIERIGSAGVRTIIVTGDHQGTAETVAREVGLIDGKGAVMTGDDLVHLTPEELRARATDVVVYARVSPEQKMQLVKLYQTMGEVVSVTGDGINDAPALKAADIGIAVGSGTDVAKSVADLVILDDNFETIVASIEEGRHTINNIRKAIVYLFSSLFDELVMIGGALLLGLAFPLNALQILFVNFFADSFPAIAFANERNIDGIGTRPTQLRKGMFDRNMKFLIFVIGSMTSVLLFFLYVFLLRAGYNVEIVRTFIFGAFATYSLLLAFSVRSLEKSIFSYNPFSNVYLTAGVLFGITMTLCAIYVPFAHHVFDTVALPLPWLAGVFVVGIANMTLVEIGKVLLRSKKKSVS